MNDPSPLEAIFFAALEKGARQERAAYLDLACAGDPDLRRHVEKMLAAQAQAGSFLEQPAPSSVVTVDEQPISEGAGTVIGPYKLLEQIGEGGMGIVYMAEQTEPVHRKVALKIIKPGMDTKQVIARFEAERQALAMMDHPNIAKVFDAGATNTNPKSEIRNHKEVGATPAGSDSGFRASDSGFRASDFSTGRPYFVMELVRGIPITEYCDQHRLTIPERLELFMQVCQAVQHAHQKGIIHRDIKPTNVLVTALDGKPMPRVIDFGIAKATGQSLTDKTLFTGFAQLIGTPLYMSPEQAELSAVDIDTRSDIYSLGVLLYELLTGTTPLDQDTFRTAVLDEVRRMIREDEPPKPSTRLSALGIALTTVSANRQTDARNLNRSLRGELDWIVMKALEKDRSRRYETASGLARDVERYLSGHPIEAGPPSGWYRFRKFARRNRVILTATLLAVLALKVGLAVSVWQAILARRAKADATSQRDRAMKAEADALAQRDVARERLVLARDAVDDMYTQVATQWLEKQPRLDPTQRDFLLKALAAYERFTRGEVSDSPAMRRGLALASQRAGQIRLKLGEFREAESELRRALAIQEDLANRFPSAPEHHRDQPATLRSLALLLETTGRPGESLAASRRAVALQTKLAADFPRDTGLRRSLARDCLELGRVLLVEGRLDEAEQVDRRALELGRALARDFPSEPDNRLVVSRSLDALGTLLTDRGRAEEGLEIGRESLEVLKKLASDSAGEPNYRLYLAGAYGNLGYHLSKVDRRPEAIDATRRAVDLQTELASDFPSRPLYQHFLSLYLTNLGDSLRRDAQYPEAVRVAEQARKVAEALVAEHPTVPDYREQLGNILDMLGKLLAQAGRPAEAEVSFGRAAAIFDKLATDDPNRWEDQKFLATTYFSWVTLLACGTAHGGQEPGRAVRLAEQAVARCPRSLEVWGALGLARYQARDHKGAIAAVEKALALDPSEDGDLWMILALAHARMGDLQQARGLYVKAVAWMNRQPSGTYDLRERLRAEAAALLGRADATVPKDKELNHSK